MQRNITVTNWNELEGLINRRDFKRAEVMLARIVRTQQPHEVRTRVSFYRAKLRLLVGRAPEALHLLEDVRHTDAYHTTPEYQEVLADAHFQKYELAIVGFADRTDLLLAQDTYKSILARFPQYSNTGWVHYQLGRLMLASGQPAYAEAHFRQALFEPSYLITLTSMAYERLAYISLYEHRAVHPALTFIDKAIATYPQPEPRPWLVQALLLKSKIYQYADIPQALQTAKDALDMASRRGTGVSKALIAEASFTVADLASKTRGMEHDVIEYVGRFLNLSRSPLGVDVTWSRAHEMLAESYFALGRYDQALNAYEAMLQFNPYYPWMGAVRLRMAQCCFRLGNPQRTVALCTAIIADAEEHDQAQVYSLLAQAHELLNQPEAARHALALAAQQLRAAR